MKNIKGLTILEMMIVTGLVSGIFVLMVSIMMHSDTYWQKGQNKIQEHQEARHIVDSFVKIARQSSPSWNVNGTHYSASISEDNKRLDLYVPVYNNDSTVNSLVKVTYRVNPDNEGELWRKTGTGDVEVVSGMLDTIYFGGSCDCTPLDPMNCNSVNTSCPAIRVLVSTRKENGFNLTTDVMLRNWVNLILSNATGIDEPEEGEF
jgi:hypothetical protein